MSPKALLAALDGLMAYDCGATDSGIHDDALKERCRQTLHVEPARWFPVLRAHALGYLEAPYGPEDACEFLRWLRDEMWISVDLPGLFCEED